MTPVREFHQVRHITTDAIGPPGKRVFYIQARTEAGVITVIVEKFQVLALAEGVETFFQQLQRRFPHLEPPAGVYEEEAMRIHPPVDPLFRVGDIGLGYDPEHDLVALQLTELLPPDREEEEARVLRFWCTREQLWALCLWGREVAARGRPICPQCGEPMDDPQNHFCPKKNGHR